MAGKGLIPDAFSVIFYILAPSMLKNKHLAKNISFFPIFLFRKHLLSQNRVLSRAATERSRLYTLDRFLG